MEYEEEEEWYNYLTMDGTDDYAMIWMEGSDMNTLWVWDPSGATCTLTTDWKTEDMEDGAYGFYVSDPDGTCPYVESEDTLWTYAWLESDEEGNPISVTGPYGNEWLFTEPEDFEDSYYDDYDYDYDYDSYYYEDYDYDYEDYDYYYYDYYSYDEYDYYYYDYSYYDYYYYYYEDYDYYYYDYYYYDYYDYDYYDYYS